MNGKVCLDQQLKLTVDKKFQFIKKNRTYYFFSILSCLKVSETDDSLEFLGRLENFFGVVKRNFALLLQ